MDAVKNIVIFVAVLLLFLAIIFSGLSNVGRIEGIETKYTLFPNDFSEENNLMAPLDNVYGVWVFLYIYQVCWMCYAVSLGFRSNAPDLLDKKFYTSYAIALVFNIVWMFIWSREMFALGFVFYVLQAIFLNINLYFAFSAYDQYYQSSPVTTASSFDFWCFRLLLINGIAFFTGWVSSTAFVQFSFVLQTEMDVSQVPAAKAALSLMLISLVIWSALQNSVCEVYTRLMFAEYVPLIVVLAGMIAKQWNYQHEDVRSYALALFIIALMLLIFRIGMIVTRETKRGALPLAQAEPTENVKLI